MNRIILARIAARRKRYRRYNTVILAMAYTAHSVDSIGLRRAIKCLIWQHFIGNVRSSALSSLLLLLSLAAEGASLWNFYRSIILNSRTCILTSVKSDIYAGLVEYLSDGGTLPFIIITAEQV